MEIADLIKALQGGSSFKWPQLIQQAGGYDAILEKIYAQVRHPQVPNREIQPFTRWSEALRNQFDNSVSYVNCVGYVFSSKSLRPNLFSKAAFNPDDSLKSLGFNYAVSANNERLREVQNDVVYRILQNAKSSLDASKQIDKLVQLNRQPYAPLEMDYSFGQLSELMTYVLACEKIDRIKEKALKDPIIKQLCDYFERNELGLLDEHAEKHKEHLLAHEIFQEAVQAFTGSNNHITVRYARLGDNFYQTICRVISKTQTSAVRTQGNVSAQSYLTLSYVRGIVRGGENASLCKQKLDEHLSGVEKLDLKDKNITQAELAVLVDALIPNKKTMHVDLSGNPTIKGKNCDALLLKLEQNTSKTLVLEADIMEKKSPPSNVVSNDGWHYSEEELAKLQRKLQKITAESQEPNPKTEISCPPPNNESISVSARASRFNDGKEHLQ